MPLRTQIARVVAFTLVLLQMAGAADLSPSKWTPDDRKRAEKLEMGFLPADARNIEGRAGLISNTGSPIALRAGMEALKQGGTAADAAATAALTQISVWLGSLVSYAGALHVIYYEAKSGKVYSLDAGWNSYPDETNPRTIPVSDGAEGRKTLVPGFMAGIEVMHRRFGRLPFAHLFQPAIWYAENGVTVTPTMAALFGLYGKSLSRTAEGELFIHQAGSDMPKVGDKFVQDDLAKTLRGVAKRGARYMYTGAWGEQFVAAVQREGGKVTMEDMRNYRPVWEEPLSTAFADTTVVVPGKGNESGHQILEALNLIAELHLDQNGPYWKDPRVFRQLSQVLQLVEVGPFVTPEVAAYQRKNGLEFSLEDRTTKAYAKAMAPMIGEVESVGPAQPSSHHSAGTVVIDRWGNVAAIVHTIEDSPWGSTGIVVGGIPLSGIAGKQQALLTTIKPGERFPGLPCPIIVMAGNKPALALATVGFSLVPETVRIVLGAVGNHLDPRTVVAAPPLLYNFERPQAGESYTWKRQFVPEGAYSAEFLNDLEVSGVKLEQKPREQVLALRGTAALAMIDPRTGIRRTFENPAIIDFADAY